MQVSKLNEVACHDWIPQSDRVYGECLFVGKRVPVMKTSATGRTVVDYYDPNHDMAKIKALSSTRRLSFLKQRTTIHGAVSQI